MVNVESRASRGKSCTKVPVALRVTECICLVNRLLGQKIVVSPFGIHRRLSMKNKD